jgi:hypothetical protein
MFELFSAKVGSLCPELAVRNVMFIICHVTSEVCSSSSCGRQTVDQFVWVSGLPLGPLTRFYLALLFSADNYLIILSRAVVCTATTRWYQ